MLSRMVKSAEYDEPVLDIPLIDVLMAFELDDFEPIEDFEIGEEDEYDPDAGMSSRYSW